jgi:hypothetical protein
MLSFHTSKWVVGLATLASGVALAACSSTPSRPTTAPTVRSTTTTTAASLTTGTIVLNGKSYPVPSEAGTRPITPFADTGEQVVLTSSGFLPRTLYASTQQAVVFTNLTTKPVTLTIEDVGLKPAVLQPGATYHWIPNVLAFGYKSSTGDGGIVQVGAFPSQQ